MDQQCIGLLQNNGRMWWENPTQWQDCQELRLKELWVKLMKNSKQASCMGLSSFLGFILSHILWNKLLTLSTHSIGEACVWRCWGGRSFPWIRSACQVEQSGLTSLAGEMIVYGVILYRGVGVTFRNIIVAPLPYLLSEWHWDYGIKT
jgi:hypothetical protein